MEDLIVTVGEDSILISEDLLNKQNAWENLSGIKKCHKAKIMIYNIIKITEDKIELKQYAKQLEALEFKLQELWGFPLNKLYHKFWLYPKCNCPSMDNEDAYPYLSYTNSSCPLHGDS